MRSLFLVLAGVVALAGCGATEEAGVTPLSDAGFAPDASVVEGVDAGAAPVPDAGFIVPFDAGTPATPSESIDLLSVSMSISETRSAVGADGVQHLIFSSNGAQPIYARCAKNCGVRSSWSFTTLAKPAGATGFSYAKAVAVDGQGRVWALFYVLGFSDGSQGEALHQCAANCGVASSWQAGVVASGSRWTNTGSRFVVEKSGRAWLGYSTYGATVLATCSSSCTSATSWTHLNVTTRSEAINLAVTSTGNPRMLLTRVSGSEGELAWWSCDQSCGVATNWSSAAVFIAARYTDPRLVLDGADRPRVMFNTGSIGGAPSAYDDTLYFTWCDSNCGSADSWTGTSVGAKKDGRIGVDFALHNGAVVAVGSRDSFGTVLLKCSGNCTSQSGAWSARVLETRESFTALTAPAVPADFTNAYWRVGLWPQLVLNPVHQTVNLAWTNLAKGTHAGREEDGAYLARIAELPL